MLKIQSFALGGGALFRAFPLHAIHALACFTFAACFRLFLAVHGDPHGKLFIDAPAGIWAALSGELGEGLEALHGRRTTANMERLQVPLQGLPDLDDSLLTSRDVLFFGVRFSLAALHFDVRAVEFAMALFELIDPKLEKVASALDSVRRAECLVSKELLGRDFFEFA